jgi:teichoic acid transport system permease protein
MNAPSNPTPGLRRLDVEQSSANYLRGMWQRREFAIALPVENLRVAHQNTLLGNVWHLFNPLLSVAVFYVIFGVMLNTSRGVDHFILWLVIGVFTYQLTSTSVTQGARALTGNVGLMRSMRFPRALLPVSSVLAGLFHFGFEVAIMVLVAFASGVGPSTRWLVFPLILALQSTLNLGGAFVTARLNDTFSDVEQLIPFVFRLLMYLSGVMFPIRSFVKEDTPQLVKVFIDWNPLINILEMYRWALLGTSVDPRGIVNTVIVALVLLVFGFRFFRAGEPRYGLH